MPDVESPAALILSIFLTLTCAGVLGRSFFGSLPRELEGFERDPALAALEEWACGTHGLWFFLRPVGLALLCLALGVLFYKSVPGIGRLFS